MIKILTFFFIFFLSSNAQSSIECTLKELALFKVVPGIAFGLECKNEDAIRADIDALLDKYNICKEDINTYVGDKGLCGLLCRKYFPKLIESSVDYIIPAKWECKATNLKAILTDVVLSQCDKL